MGPPFPDNEVAKVTVLQSLFNVLVALLITFASFAICVFVVWWKATDFDATAKPNVGEKRAEMPAQKRPELPARKRVENTAERIGRLIEQLGDGDYFVRERAQQELAQIGFEAFDALSAAEDHDDVEVAARAKYLVRMMRIDWTADGDPAEVKVLLVNYPSANETARFGLIKQLAALPDDKGLWCSAASSDSSVRHWYRNKRPSPRSTRKPTRKPGRVASGRSGKASASSTRTSAEWLKTYLESAADPAAAVDAWRKRAEAEERTLAEAPSKPTTRSSRRSGDSRRA